MTIPQNILPNSSPVAVPFLVTNVGISAYFGVVKAGVICPESSAARLPELYFGMFCMKSADGKERPDSVTDFFVHPETLSDANDRCVAQIPAPGGHADGPSFHTRHLHCGIESACRCRWISVDGGLFRSTDLVLVPHEITRVKISVQSTEFREIERLPNKRRRFSCSRIHSSCVPRFSDRTRVLRL